MERKHVFGVAAFAMIALLGLGAVSAHGFGFGHDLTDEEFAEMEAHREAMQDAIETGDYAAWEGMMHERLAEFEDSIDEETFNEMVQMHQGRLAFHEAIDEARETGDWSEVEAMRDEMGFGEAGMGRGHMGGRGMMQGQGGFGECPFAN